MKPVLNIPKFVRLAKDDLMWIFDYDHTKTYKIDPFKYPTLFFDFYVFDYDSPCKKSDDPLQVIQVNVGGNRLDTQFVGICGTRIVLADGYNAGLFSQFNEWKEAQGGRPGICEGEWEAFLAEKTDKEPLDVWDDYWEGFEKSLHDQPLRKNNIDFVFMGAEKKIAIHFELGMGEDFRESFKSAVAAKPEKFKAWLIQTNGGLIPRKAFFADTASGNGIVSKTEVTMPTITFNPGSVPLQDLIYDPTDCPDPSCPNIVACTVGMGTITDAADDLSTATVTVDMIGTKPYCVDGAGNPCDDL